MMWLYRRLRRAIELKRSKCSPATTAYLSQLRESVKRGRDDDTKATVVDQHSMLACDTPKTDRVGDQDSLLDNEKLEYRCWALYVPKEEMIERIQTRTKTMLDGGFEKEVASLGEVLKTHSVCSNIIGYKELLSHSFDSDKCSKGCCENRDVWKEAIQQEINTHTWQLVRKQLTWLRRNSQFRWLHYDNGTTEDFISHIVRDYDAASPMYSSKDQKFSPPATNPPKKRKTRRVSNLIKTV
eukprot:Platyproteum_vivax@DN3352_c0_g1_i2.p1